MVVMEKKMMRITVLDRGEMCVERLGCLKSSFWQPEEVKHLCATEVPLNHYFNIYTSEVKMTFEKSPRMYPDFNKYYS